MALNNYMITSYFERLKRRASDLVREFVVSEAVDGAHLN